MKPKIKLINLYKLTDEKVWARLKELTSRGGFARPTFEAIHRNSQVYKYRAARICALEVEGQIVAWALYLKVGIGDERLWAYTAPEHRRKGYQRDYLMPYWANYKPNCSYQADNERKARTFAAYVRAKNS